MRRYSAVAIALHWLTAGAILFQLGLAQRMEGPDGPDKFAVFQLHKSVGVTILALTLLRLAWRISHKPPPSAVTGWEKRLSAAVHWVFYGLLIILPLTGWLTVSSSRLSLPTMLYGAVPFPDLPVPKTIHGAASTSHHVLASVLIGLLLLHVAGALKHQFWKGDERVIPRMAGKIPWWLIAVGAVAVFAGGLLVRPPAPAMQAAPAVAAPPALAAHDLPGANWIVQPGSQLVFATAWSGQPIEGRFERWAAAIALDPEKLNQARVRAVIDLASANSGDGQRDATLKAGDWFDVAAHPTAAFTADDIEPNGDGFVAHGTLTLKGVSRPLDLPFKMAVNGDQANAEGQAVIDRTVFGIGRGQGSGQIPATVTVRLMIRAKRKI